MLTTDVQKVRSAHSAGWSLQRSQWSRRTKSFLIHITHRQPGSTNNLHLKLKVTAHILINAISSSTDKILLEFGPCTHYIRHKSTFRAAQLNHIGAVLLVKLILYQNSLITCLKKSWLEQHQCVLKVSQSDSHSCWGQYKKHTPRTTYSTCVCAHTKTIELPTNLTCGTVMLMVLDQYTCDVTNI